MIINGRLIKNITIKTAHDRDCHRDMKRVCGDVRHCTVEIPFHLFVDLPGTKDDDECEVTEAIIAGEFDKLINKNCDGLFETLLEKVVIKVRAKVIRMKHLEVSAEDITPEKLRCPRVEDVVVVEGLDIKEEC